MALRRCINKSSSRKNQACGVGACLELTFLSVWYATLMTLACCRQVGMECATTQAAAQRKRAAQTHGFAHLERVLCFNFAFAVIRVRVDATLQIFEGGVESLQVNVK